jgi:adenine-specific DNA-methyltransferase
MAGTNSGPSSAYLKIAGVQQAHKEDKIIFTSLAPWPDEYTCAEGRYTEAVGSEESAGIFIGPESGTVTRDDSLRTDDGPSS